MDALFKDILQGKRHNNKLRTKVYSNSPKTKRPLDSEFPFRANKYGRGGNTPGSGGRLGREGGKEGGRRVSPVVL